MKKILAILLSMAVILTMTPSMVFAGTETEPVPASTLPDAVGGVVTLDQDYVVDTLDVSKTITYNLNGYTLKCTSASTLTVTGDTTIKFVDNSSREEKGTLRFANKGNVTSSDISPEAGSTVIAEGITIDSPNTVFFPKGNAAKVEVKNCTVSAGCYCVGTNAATVDNYGVIINLEKSTFTATNSFNDNCPVMINVPGTLNIEDCNITGQRQGVIVRAGEATISKSSINTSGYYNNRTQYYDGSWGTGNEVPAAALTVGNRDGNYSGDAVVTVESCDITGEKQFPALFVAANTTQKATVNVGGNSEISSNESVRVDSINAKFVLNSGTINIPEDYGIFCTNGATAEVKGGTISSKYAALTGNNLIGDMNFTVAGGTLTAGEGPAIYMPGQVTLNVTGGTLNGGVSLRMGQVNISGGIFNAITEKIDSPTREENYSYSGNVWFPDALYVIGGTYPSSNTEYGNSLNLNISGGEFNCTNSEGSAVAIYDLGLVEQAMAVSISGGAKLKTVATGRNAYDVLKLSDLGVENPKEGYNNDNYVGHTTTTITGGTFSENPKAYVAEDIAIYLKGLDYYVGEEPTHSSGKNRWALGDDGIYTEYLYIAPSAPPAPADPITNDSGNTAAGTVASTTLDAKPVTTTAGGVKTTTGTVDAATGDKLVEKAVANKSEEVVVDVTTSNANASSAAGAKTEVTLPEATVQALAEQTDASVDIRTDNASVTLDNEAVKEVAKQAGTTGEVKLVVETVKSDAKEVRIEVKLVTSNGAVTNFGAGNVEVTVPADQFKNKNVVCVYIDDEGNYTKMEGKLNADGTYTFVTNHFSTYAIMEEAEADAKIAEQNKEKVNTLIKEFKFKASTKYTSKKNVKVTAKVLEGDIDAITDMGYTVKYKFYRSEKKSSKYALKTTKTTDTYTNTAGKKGKKYYYKVRLAVYDGDTLVGESELKQSEYGVRTWKK